MSLVGYSDASYISDPQNAKSHTCYVFLCGSTVISWRSIKRTMVTTSSNLRDYSLYEASRECVWIRPLVQHIRVLCGISTNDISPAVLYEDNAARVTQMSCHTPNYVIVVYCSLMV